MQGKVSQLCRVTCVLEMCMWLQCLYIYLCMITKPWGHFFDNHGSIKQLLYAVKCVLLCCSHTSSSLFFINLGPQSSKTGYLTTTPWKVRLIVCNYIHWREWTSNMSCFLFQLLTCALQGGETAKHKRLVEQHMLPTLCILLYHLLFYYYS